MACSGRLLKNREVRLIGERTVYKGLPEFCNTVFPVVLEGSCHILEYCHTIRLQHQKLTVNSSCQEESVSLEGLCCFTAEWLANSTPDLSQLSYLAGQEVEAI